MVEADTGCDLYVSGRCHKSYYSRTKCENCRSDGSWFIDKLQVCEVGEVCRRDSIFGNAYYTITREQLEQLEEGKVLFDAGEYGTFIMLEKA